MKNGVHAMPYGFLVPADEAEVAAARRTVVKVVRGWEVPLLDETFDNLALLTTEVVTNAVRHTRAACAVAVRWTGSRVRVEVTDVDSRRPVPREGSAGAEDGRGLLLVASLSAAWDSEALPAGKVVWFEVGDEFAEQETGQPTVCLPSRTPGFTEADRIVRRRHAFALSGAVGARP
ncbi:ATP-binding protein [Streptomyces sp. NPDC008317]|uniref:ATP-binding protein n=1 Tax=Streptomyces sp. NPDC008317 TaxID=3364827 RepID=UPI0036E02B9A